MNPYQTWQLIGIYFVIAILLNAWWAFAMTSVRGSRSGYCSN